MVGSGFVSLICRTGAFGDMNNKMNWTQRHLEGHWQHGIDPMVVTRNGHAIVLSLGFHKTVAVVNGLIITNERNDSSAQW